MEQEIKTVEQGSKAVHSQGFFKWVIYGFYTMPNISSIFGYRTQMGRVGLDHEL